MIKYMKEPVTEEAMMEKHNISWAKLYALQHNNREEGSFILDGLQYDLEFPKTLKKKKSIEKPAIPVKHPSYNIRKGKLRHNGLTARLASIILERGVSALSERTCKKRTVMMNGWVVERVMV